MEDSIQNVFIKHKIVYRICCILMILLLCPIQVIPAYGSDSDNSSKVVKVAVIGYPNFIYREEDGSVTGYAKEYLDEIAKHTGWTYEYIDMTFDEANEALKNGKIDIMVGSQYTDSRADLYDYSECSMGMTGTVICILNDNDKYAYNEYSKFQGMKIGALKGSIRIEQTKKFLDKENVSANFIEYDTDKEVKEALISGEIDAMLISIIRCEKEYKVVAKINSTPMYFTTNPLDKTIKEAIDEAQNTIHIEKPYYEMELDEKYYGDITNSLVFSSSELEYIKEHPEIIVAYFDDRMPFTDTGKDGIAEGISIEIMNRISEISGIKFIYENAEIGVRAVDTLTYTHAELYLGLFDSELAKFADNLEISDTFITTYLTCVGRDKDIFLGDNNCTIALSIGNISTEEVLQEKYQNLSFKYYDTIEDTIKAVTNNEADYSIIDVYAADYLLQNLRYSDLITSDVYRFEQKGFVGALNTQDSRLLSIINKCILELDNKEISQIVSDYQSSHHYEESLTDTIYKNRNIIILIGVGVFAIISMLMVLMVLKKRNEKRLFAKNVELESAIVKVEQANNAKNDFLSRMSHDMRTPMNAIMGMTALAGKSIDDKEKVGEYLHKIESSSEYLLELINDLLDMSKMENLNMKLVYETICVKNHIQGVVDIIEPRLREKNIRFIHKTEGIDVEYVRIDKKRLTQVVVNILSNAAKFTPEGGQVEFYVKQVYKNDKIAEFLITIKDNGVGISKEFMPMIFMPFEQENKTGNYEGTGLGLSITKKLVELMNGTIETESEKGKGTTFTIRIQMEISDEKSCNRNSNAPKITNEKYRLLLVEDNNLNSEIARSILEIEGHCVESAENGKIALEMFKNSDIGYYDAILMDMRMPVMDGLTATKEIRNLCREDAKTIPIIAVSADAYSEDMDKSINAGVTAYVTKPYNPEKLNQCIFENVIKNRSGIGEKNEQ